MTSFILDDIRNLILKKQGISEIMPSDCLVIASAISKELNKSVSETTIKRFFGFAAIHHQFSKFTINTLLEYVSDQKVDLTHALEIGAGSIFPNENWDEVVDQATSITKRTIQKITDSCPVPTEFTIHRKFFEYDFDYFYKSKHSFTTLLSQSGFGKSVLIARFIEKCFFSENTKYTKDIILFITACDIFDTHNEQQDLGEALLSILGIDTSKSFINYFNDFHETTGGKITIIIDNFNDTTKESGVKPMVFKSILKLIYDIGEHDGIKLVISMRTYVWRRFFDTIKQSIFIKKKWFTGSYFRANKHTNIPLFTEAELKILLANIGVQNPASLIVSAKQQLKYPIKFTIYYQLSKQIPLGEYNSSLIFHKVTLKYIENKIFNSTFASEKKLLCSQIIKISNQSQTCNVASKRELMPDLLKYRDPYMELLVDGVIAEECVDFDGIPKEYIHFVHENIYTYFLFTEILENHGNRMDDNFSADLIVNHAKHPHHYQLLEWLTYTIVKENQFTQLKHLINAELKGTKYDRLITLIIDKIKYKLRRDGNAISIAEKVEIQKAFLKKLPQLDFLNNTYYPILEVFGNLAVDHHTFAIYQTILILQDFLKLNIQKITGRIQELEKLAHNFSNWYINPIEIGEFLIYKINGEGDLRSPLYEKIDHVNALNGQCMFNELHNQLSFLCVAVINWIFRPSERTLKTIKAMYTNFGLEFFPDSYLNKYVSGITNFERLKLEVNFELSPATVFSDQFSVAHGQYNELTTGQAIYLLANSQKLLNQNNINGALKDANLAKEIFKNNNQLALELISLKLLINIYTALSDFDKIDELKYLVLNITERSHTSPSLFDFNFIKN